MAFTEQMTVKLLEFATGRSIVLRPVLYALKLPRLAGATSSYGSYNDNTFSFMQRIIHAK